MGLFIKLCFEIKTPNFKVNGKSQERNPNPNLFGNDPT